MKEKLADRNALIAHFNNSLDHLKQWPDLLASAELTRSSLNELVLIDNALYPRGWADQYLNRIAKPIADVTLSDIAAVIDPACQNSFFPQGLAYADLDRWRTAAGQTYRVFTGTIDYSATGEGLTLIFAAARAYTRGDFMLWLADQIGYYYVIGADVFDGLPDRQNIVAQHLVTDRVRNNLQKEITAGSRGGHIEYLLRSYVNYS